MSDIPGFTERVSPTSDRTTFDLTDMANIFEFAASHLLAIRIALEDSALVTSAKIRHIIARYLMWEGEVFILPWVAFCEGLSISPPLSRNLRFFTGMLGMSQVELLTDQELYDSFMKLLPLPSGPWVRGRIIHTYPMAWWTMPFNTMDYKEFTMKFPNCNEIRQMLINHFAQLPEGRLLVTPGTLVEARSTPVVQQLARIEAEVKQEGDYIIAMVESKIVEARLVAASMIRMETTLGQDVNAAIEATEWLVKYLKREAQ
ncbi:uncharacterized protein F5147DRAFT_659239 [Suillus discolor]|uniref:Uncharacterized protein n=1 Tax=Suillus discolor TaxID=1912936 RepID=A0A9P7ES93_9AGAM|nr:uncharacterized protein F5147DRAFT_659239 [Suillus discolor]KAG2086320.1 hypothetical protein F5147DRAFT_659239 [Suillus discolor]